MARIAHDANDRLTELLHLAGEPGEAPPGGMPTIAPTFHLSFGYDPEGDRLFMLHGAPDLMDRSEVYNHDNRHRLTAMRRGAATQDGGGAWDVDAQDLLDHPALPGEQAWTMLDRRGNWLEFKEKRAGADRTETRETNDANEYTKIDPDGRAAR